MIEIGIVFKLKDNSLNNYVLQNKPMADFCFLPITHETEFLEFRN